MIPILVCCVLRVVTFIYRLIVVVDHVSRSTVGNNFLAIFHTASLWHNTIQY
jgi:hypothetical protein